ncbi:HEPN domain-containing protein [Bradyrhizobium septentrionale]|uniref:HEPN domain-containing protein n=1 Tax=Bradyrhizobium septentrionale TaxID=1404411 RepID=A0ABZ2NVF8_9BRAD
MDTLLGATLSGVFWATDNPASKLSGSLDIDENGSATLSVEGDHSVLTALDARQKFQMHGSAEGKDITLFDCFTTWVPFLSADMKARIAVNIVVVGARIDGPEATFASGLSFTTPEVIRWTGLRGITYKDAKREVKVTYRSKKTKEVQVGGATFQVGTGIQYGNRSVSELSLTERHGVRVVFSEPQSVFSVDRWITKICRLMSLALRSPMVCRVCTLERGTGGGPVTMVATWSENKIVEAKTPHPLFTRPKRREVYEKVLRSWFAQHDKLEPVISLRVALLSQPQRYHEFAILTYVQALETLHRRTRPARTLVTKRQFSALQPKLVEAIPARWKAKPDLARKLEYLNEISLTDRLRDVFACDKELLSKLFRDNEKDVALIRDIRNYLIHYEGKRKEKKIKAYIATAKFWYLTSKVLLLLEIAILRAIGFSQGEVRRLIQNDPTYRDLCRADHSR